MPTYRPLSGIAPEPNSFVTWYTCPSGNAIINTINICNRNSSSVNFQILLNQGGADGQSGQYLIDTNITSKNVYSRTEGWILSSGGKLVVKNDATGISYNGFVKEF